ncbi:MAG TPA: NAD(P)-binding domain-containing protein [Ktedonosporobacter sp.]|nr:NAD(P)-binding domain-containing protein [Ktedonosporobacter sp.]
MSLSLDIQKPKDSTPTATYDVVVLGAGPYGLSATAHLRAQGLKVAIFGKPIDYWRSNMPEGMLLRSFWWASNLSDPEGKYGLTQYFQLKGMVAPDPLPIETFIDYALWFQKNVVPDVDETYIAHIERDKQGQYIVTLEDGRVVQSKTVVMAPGLHYYRYVPKEYAHMPASLVSHTAEHSTLDQFVGKTVAFIGKGQASLETAALANEKGVIVHVITRGSLHWLPVSNPKVPLWIRQIRAPMAGMGNGWLNFLLEKYPYALNHFTREAVDHVMDSKHGPAGSPWLRPRLFGKVTLHQNTHVEKVEEVDGKAKLTFTNGETLVVDHIILGTGYRADIRRLPMLDSYLLDEIYAYRGCPVLNNWFETNVPGLYFLGYTSARSFGPFYRFVVGTDAAARRVAAAIARKLVPAR